jgi:hypothetical protein
MCWVPPIPRHKIKTTSKIKLAPMALRIGLPGSSNLQNDGHIKPVILLCGNLRYINPKSHWGPMLFLMCFVSFVSSLVVLVCLGPSCPRTLGMRDPRHTRTTREETKTKILSKTKLAHQCADINAHDRIQSHMSFPHNNDHNRDDSKHFTVQGK